KPQTMMQPYPATLRYFKAGDDDALLTELIHRLISGLSAQLALLDGTRSGPSDIRKGSHTQHSPFDVAIGLAGCRLRGIPTRRVYCPPPDLDRKCTISAKLT